MVRMFLQLIGVLGATLIVILAVSAITNPPPSKNTALQQQTAPLQYATSTIERETRSEIVEPAPVSVNEPEPVPIETQPAAAAQSQEADGGAVVRRVQDPYAFPAKSESEIDTLARAAVVNIYCESERGPIGSVSGSGVVIDPRGVILTNAHVAQYVLLASDPRISLECDIRTGSPAQKRYDVDILYMPSAWVEKHAADIAAANPRGTGEYDYALLLITQSVDGSPLPASFPYLSIDTREAIAFASDSVLLLGYPAEFAGSDRPPLYPVSIVTRISDMLTFAESTVDLLGLDRVVLAQSGSSGGAVVNMWGQLVGVITTTSEGATPQERRLRALSLAYIDRDISRGSGSSLGTLLLGDVAARARVFMQNEAPSLAQKIISFLP